MPDNNASPPRELQIADELFATQRYREAIEAYRKLLDTPGHDRLALLEKLGWSCYLEGLYKDALRYFQWYESLSPGELTTQTMIGLCALETGALTEAHKTLSAVVTNPLAGAEAHAAFIKTLIRLHKPYEASLQKWWNTASITPDLTYGIASELMDTNPLQAEAFLETALSRFPEDPLLSYGMAICCLKQGDYARATLFCEDIIAKQPDTFPLATLIVIIHRILTGNLTEANALIQQAQEKNWIDSEWHRQLGEAWKTRDPEQAKTHLWAAIQSQPSDDALWFTYLDILSHSQEHEEFFFVCTEAYRYTHNPRFLKAAGAFALSWSMYERAQEFLRQAYDLSGEKEILLLLILALFSSSERHAENIVSLASSLSPDPSINPFTAYAIGKSYLIVGDTDQAATWFRQTLSYFPDDANHLYGMALVEIERHNWTEAIQYLQKAKSRIQHPHILYALGLCFLKTGNMDEALPLLLSYGETQQDEKTYFQIGLMLTQEKHHREAIPFFTKVLELNPSHKEAQNFLHLLKTLRE